MCRNSFDIERMLIYKFYLATYLYLYLPVVSSISVSIKLAYI